MALYTFTDVYVLRVQNNFRVIMQHMYLKTTLFL